MVESEFEDLGPNSGLAEEMHGRYVEDPTSVPDEWREFFDHRDDGASAPSSAASSDARPAPTPTRYRAPEPERPSPRRSLLPLLRRPRPRRRPRRLRPPTATSPCRCGAQRRGSARTWRPGWGFTRPR